MSTALDLLLPSLKTEEGFRATKYTDTQGHTSIGYGWNIDAGISPFAASALLTAQVQELEQALMRIPWYVQLDPVRQRVCLDIAFNDGLSGLLAFPSMIHYLSIGDWFNAAAQCRVKNLELGPRYAVLAHMLLTGSTT
jgi:lysozyme